ncbi:MAG: DUF6788 family protein [Acidimicrobiales bacterium]
MPVGREPGPGRPPRLTGGEIAGTGNVRSSVSATYRRCGKANCAWGDPAHPGHGPRHLLTRSVEAKTEARQVAPGPELDKVNREVAN